MNIGSFLQGMLFQAGLITALGPQNLFVVRQAIERRHARAAVAVCIGCDVFLIALGGVTGSALAGSSAVVGAMLRMGGVFFLGWYGVDSMRRGLKPSKSSALRATERRMSTLSVVAAGLGVSLLNPGVYVDTILMIGGTASSLAPGAKEGFLLGAMGASCLWFTAIAGGARAASLWLADPGLRRFLDGVSGAVLLGMAVSLLISR